MASTANPTTPTEPTRMRQFNWLIDFWWARIPGVAFNVALALWRHSDEAGLSFATGETLTKGRTSRRAVIKGMSWLMDNGWVKVEEALGKRGVRANIPVRRLTIPPPPTENREFPLNEVTENREFPLNREPGERPSGNQESAKWEPGAQVSGNREFPQNNKRAEQKNSTTTEQSSENREFPLAVVEKRLQELGITGKKLKELQGLGLTLEVINHVDRQTRDRKGVGLLIHVLETEGPTLTAQGVATHSTTTSSMKPFTDAEAAKCRQMYDADPERYKALLDPQSKAHRHAGLKVDSLCITPIRVLAQRCQRKNGYEPSEFRSEDDPVALVLAMSA
jgi:hypothetical protein